jgi:hypothetical protein
MSPSRLAIIRRRSQYYEEILIHISLWFPTLKIEATCSSETSDDSQRATWRCIPEDRTLYIKLAALSGSYTLAAVTNVTEDVL